MQREIACDVTMEREVYVSLDRDPVFTAADSRKDSEKFVQNVCETLDRSEALLVAREIGGWLRDPEFRKHHTKVQCENFEWQAGLKTVAFA